jgi:hypothetical protein
MITFSMSKSSTRRKGGKGSERPGDDERGPEKRDEGGVRLLY